MTNEELAGVDELVGRLRQPNECERWLFSVPFEAADMLQSLIATAREAEALRAENARLQARADAARREALEEAAKVADGYAAAGKDNPQLAPISAQMRYCAQRIRALKGSQQ